jgi:hypothetical protein
MLDYLESGWEEEGEGAEDSCCALIESACVGVRV